VEILVSPVVVQNDPEGVFPEARVTGLCRSFIMGDFCDDFCADPGKFRQGFVSVWVKMTDGVLIRLIFTGKKNEFLGATFAETGQQRVERQRKCRL
jgi:hypothetical protein